jgi:hypothetical protein
MTTTGNGATGLVKWLLGIFASLIIILVVAAFDAAADARNKNEVQNLDIQRLRWSDSIQTRTLQRIEDKIDRIDRRLGR